MHPVSAGGLRTRLVAMMLLFTLAGCGDGSSPTTPTPAPTPTPGPAPSATASLASLSASPTTVSGAGTSAVTVTLAAAVASATTVALSSSNAAVLSVPATIVVPSGQTSAAVNATTSPVTATTTATITATLGSATQTAQVTVQAGALQSLSFEPTSIRSQGNAVGTVTLSASAPPGGATVALESRNRDVLKVPSTVVVPAGVNRATFTAEGTTIRFRTTVTVDATYAGVSAQATVSVGPPELAANFTVTSESRGQSDVCVIVPTGTGIKMDCVLDASSSRGFPSSYKWTMRNGDKSTTWTSSEASSRPPVDCDVLGGGTLSNDALGIYLDLVVNNDDGTAGTSRNILFLPNGRCGY